jgi:ribosomal protein L39E
MFGFLKTLYLAFRSARKEPNWHIIKEAKPSKSHPLGGFWKRSNLDEQGLAIGSAGGAMYFVSFCGPGGCFAKGQYRPNTTVFGDPDYKVVDENTIEVKGKNGFSRYTRCASKLGSGHNTSSKRLR